jgi:tetratricopeptide (TPR) repeat protein
MTDGGTLVLRLLDLREFEAWRWVLEDDSGTFIAEHHVALDRRAPEYEAILSLPDYLYRFAAPDRQRTEERRLLRDVGSWLGANVLGPVAEVVAERAPVIVRVCLPPSAERLIAMPLEIAHAFNKPLALQRVGFVFQIVGDEPAASHHREGTERLRILAVFSVTASGALNLRRERQALRRLVRDARRAGKDVELRVLQYGSTYESLRDALQDRDGWDVIHFSGHGAPGELELERADGSADCVRSDDIIELLAAPVRLKLVTLSSCLSAAAETKETRARLGLEAALQDESRDAPALRAGAQVEMSMARALVRETGCAVLAMRFAVDDRFAVSFVEVLYDRLLNGEQSLAATMPSALSSLVNERPEAADPASTAAPVLLGSRAAALRLEPPTAPRRSPDPVRIAGFPEEPASFVGRTGAMTQASGTLAAPSRHAGVLFYGLPGGGKTACALELAYHHEQTGRFVVFVWYAAEDGDEPALSLDEFAKRLDAQCAPFLSGLRMVELIERINTSPTDLGRITEFFKQTAVLVIVDSVEKLLNPAGVWHDQRWSVVLRAICANGGRSRLVLTSRVRPRDLDASLQVVPLNALASDEELILVDELPNLDRLARSASAEWPENGGSLVAQVTRIAQGHPWMLQFAESLARDPALLERQLSRAASEGAAEFRAFLETGEPSEESTRFLAALADWTRLIADDLDPPARTFFLFLCALHEGDRHTSIVEANWNEVWTDLQMPGRAPDPGMLYPQLVEAGLIERDGAVVRLNRGVAEAGYGHAGSDLRNAVDVEMGRFWFTQMVAHRDGMPEGLREDGAIVHASLSAFPYLARQRRWNIARSMLAEILPLDSSPQTLSALLPLVRTTAAALAGTPHGLAERATLSRILLELRHFAEAEAEIRGALDEAVEARDYRQTKILMNDLLILLRQTGRPEIALDYYERTKGFIDAMPLGPWTRANDEAGRIQMLLQIDSGEEGARDVTRLEQAARDVEALFVHVATLPDPPGEDDDLVVPWRVREVVLSTGYAVASKSRQWQDAVDWNEALLENMQSRGATEFEIASMTVNSCGPLVEVRKYEQALLKLQSCRTVAEEHQDLELLQAVFTALAGCYHAAGQFDAAVAQQKTSLRYAYAKRDHTGFRIGHTNLATYMGEAGDERGAACHGFAAAMLVFLTGEDFESVLKRVGWPKHSLSFRMDIKRSGGPSKPWTGWHSTRLSISGFRRMPRETNSSLQCARCWKAMRRRWRPQLQNVFREGWIRLERERIRSHVKAVRECREREKTRSHTKAIRKCRESNNLYVRCNRSRLAKHLGSQSDFIDKLDPGCRRLGSVGDFRCSSRLLGRSSFIGI